MKKYLIYIIPAVLVLICLTVFIITRFSKVNDSSENNIIESEASNKEDNVLVVYFSVAGEVYNVGEVTTGNTELVASYIKEYLNADLFRIEPEVEYPTKYEELQKVAEREKKQDARPKIKNKIKDIDKYDTIFLGYPIWNEDLPQILYTFLEEYDLRGKKIIPFNTHEGSWEAGTYSIIEKKQLRSTVVPDGLAIKGSVARTEEGKNQVINWLKFLEY